jgi:hypothetical protein
MSQACCDKPVTRIDINASESTLSFAYCRRCDTGRWYRNGAETTIGGVLDVAQRTWNKKVNVAA